ncbi:MAG: hypothetical protein NZ700_17240 [Gemmataceae bacterium]|nr:hypothetical protein [Gemmataceae bacterium]MDW8264847.1 hypothetical protein [Gemmataceae bacterium]
MRHPKPVGIVLVTTLPALLAILVSAFAQQVHRNSFEGRQLAWVKGPADADFRELRHEISDQVFHTGQLAEHLQLMAETGSFVHYYYPTGRAPISEELSTSLWIKANRPGIQLMARVVLPRERNPKNLQEPLTTVIRGDTYDLAGRWQRLELRRPVKLAKEQQQFMRAELQRDVDFTDAFIDQLILNVYSGPGLTELWIDDLEIGPLMEPPPFLTTSRPASAPGGPEAPPQAIGRAVVELNAEHLLVNGKRFFIRGIRHSDTPLKALRDAGFNTVWFSRDTSPARWEEAVGLGFWIVPSLSITSHDPRSVSVESITQEVRQSMPTDAVLFWDLGGGLIEEQASVIEATARLLRAADPQRPVGADVWDGFQRYTRHLDLVGVHRWPLMTGMELAQFRDWLDQRRRLAFARRGTFLWTWIQTHLPDWYTTLVYNRPGTGTFSEPIGPQPEQIRLLTYIALASGCRGIGFWSDRFLADSHQGRDRLLALALLNLEMQMLEPLLTTVTGAPTWIETSHPAVQAAVLRTDKGILVLPMWLGQGSQFVPGQAATIRLTMVVPQVPPAAQAWEVQPGEVISLPMQRVPGGTAITIPEFGLTSAVVFTSDNGATGLVVRFQDQVRRWRKLAAQWSHDLAAAEMEKVFTVQAALERAGRTLPDAASLQENARRRLKNCETAWNNGDYRSAYLEAQRALRPLRILMRAQWEQAIRGLDTPVASPFAVSFYTLPRHWEFLEAVSRSTPGSNMVPEGNFETSPDRAPVSWTIQEITLDDVTMQARRVAAVPADQRQLPPVPAASDKKDPPPSKALAMAPDYADPQEGQQSLMLQVLPRPRTTADGKPLPPPQALERTYLAITSPSVSLPPGSLVRVSGWIRIPYPIQASADGVLMFDSAGGEPLAVRLLGPTPWQRFALYRQVPPSGQISVTLALTGLGTAYFDDVRIEPLLPNSPTVNKP